MTGSSAAYGWFMLAAILIGIMFWSRLARFDERLMLIYAAALIGAFFGAKLLFVAAEGWIHWSPARDWSTLWAGKTILGGLLGGYLAVELAKKACRYEGITGDWFATIVPVGIVLGRAGCLLHGCCLGQPHSPAWFTVRDQAGLDRWPAVPMEMLFNLAMIALFFHLRKNRRLPGQHFHLYLIAYGAFRVWHEMVRATPRIAGGITGYQIGALAVLFLGAAMFFKRQGTPSPRPSLPA